MRISKQRDRGDDDVGRPGHAEDPNDDEGRDGHLELRVQLAALSLALKAELWPVVHQPTADRGHGEEDPDVWEDDDDERHHEVGQGQGGDVGAVGGAAVEVVEGAGRARAFQREVAPAHHGEHHPQHGGDPDDGDDQTGHGPGDVMHGQHSTHHHGVAVVGDGSQGVDVDQACRARANGVHLAHYPTQNTLVIIKTPLFTPL